MAKTIPKTTAGKQAKMSKVMSEWKDQTLRSSSGQTVTSHEQAVAIALAEVGKARKKGKHA